MPAELPNLAGEWIDKIFSLQAPAFEETALQIFQYQYASNHLYAQYANAVGKRPGNVATLTDIPFLPISFFKSHKLLSGNFIPEIDVAGFFKGLHLEFRCDFVKHLFQMIAFEDRVIDSFELSADTDDGLRIGCKMEVRRTDLDHEVEEFIELRHLVR